MQTKLRLQKGRAQAKGKLRWTEALDSQIKVIIYIYIYIFDHSHACNMSSYRNSCPFDPRGLESDYPLIPKWAIDVRTSYILGRMQQLPHNGKPKGKSKSRGKLRNPCLTSVSWAVLLLSQGCSQDPGSGIETGSLASRETAPILRTCALFMPHRLGATLSIHNGFGAGQDPALLGAASISTLAAG